MPHSAENDAAHDALRDALANEMHRVMCCNDPEKVAVDGFKEAADDLMPWLSKRLADEHAHGFEAGLLAAELLPNEELRAQAQAWDEGAEKARQYRDDLDLSPLNPYRVESPRYRLGPPTEADLEALVQERAQHRATGCRLFDEKTAKCTCPIPPGQT